LCLHTQIFAHMVFFSFAFNASKIMFVHFSWFLFWKKDANPNSTIMEAMTTNMITRLYPGSWWWNFT
jgi:hypothetical protein